MRIKNYLWSLPFISFLSGYIVLHLFYVPHNMTTPHIVGKKILPVVQELAKQNINLRFIAEKDSPDLPGGTILSQTPHPGQTIRPHQSIFVVISKKPQKIPAPTLTGKPIEEIAKNLSSKSIRNKSYYLPANIPENYCIAQFPAPGTPLKWNNIITYIGQKKQKPVLMPNFKNKKVTDILDFLSLYQIKSEIIHHPTCPDTHKCEDSCIITDQRPLAGSIITIDKKNPLTLHLQVKNV